MRRFESCWKGWVLMVPAPKLNALWEEKPLGEILSEVSVRASDLSREEADAARVLSLTKNFGLIPQTDRFLKRIATTDVSRYKVVRKGWLVYNPYVLWEGAIDALEQEEIGLVSPVYHVWQPKRTCSEFLSYLLKTPEMLNAYLKVAHGTVKRRRAVRTSSFKKLSVMLPPLEEQTTIARVLDATRRAEEARQHELTLERERKAALMQHLFTHGIRSESAKMTEIGEIPRSWGVAKLGAIAKIGNGSTPKRSDERYWRNGTIPWITSTKIHDLTITQADQFVTDTARNECHLPLVSRGSVVVAITGQGKTLGNAAILAIDTCINQHLAYIRFQDASVQPQFALFYLQSKYRYLREIGAAGGSTKGALTCGFLKRMSIPVPPPDQQSTIAGLLLACETRYKRLEKEVALLSEFFRAIVEELMTGRLSSIPLIEEYQPQ
jgi:type I restriction enzyme S subunit